MVCSLRGAPCRASRGLSREDAAAHASFPAACVAAAHAQGIWSGLWCLPQFDDPGQLQALAAPGPGVLQPLPPFTHVLTHRDLQLVPYHWVLPARLGVRQRAVLEARLPVGRWMSAAQALGSGLPAPIRRLLGEHLVAC